METFSVYVDGNEVNGFYLTKEQALDLARNYLDDGYETVEIGQPKVLDGQGFVKTELIAS